MPYPYTSIPTLTTWMSDSSVYFALRSSDNVIKTIDKLVEAYHNPNLTAARPETLFYLRSAIHFWMKKINAVPNNTAPTGLNSTNLPNTAKFSGSTGRTHAIHALLQIVNEELRTAFNANSDGGLKDELMQTYGADNHGLASDQQWLSKYANVSVYLTDDGVKRKNKLRFRSGVAWRWSPHTSRYERFDSTDNHESETNDRMVHFVMDQRGRIYAGFDKDVIWFKHSSLVGGENALAAGRMKVENGIITVIENDSGHYHPDHRHMRNILQRLQLYGMSIDNTVIKRNSDKEQFAAAAVLGSPGAWPDGHTGY